LHRAPETFVFLALLLREKAARQLQFGLPVSGWRAKGALICDP
jgi:hypothetical protein